MLIYLSGPITKPDPCANCHQAVMIADALVNAGFTPFVPHLSTLWQHIKPHSWEWWINYDIRIIESCGIVVRIPGESRGADAECSFARRNGIPVLYLETDDPREAVHKLQDLKAAATLLVNL